MCNHLEHYCRKESGDLGRKKKCFPSQRLCVNQTNTLKITCKHSEDFSTPCIPICRLEEISTYSIENCTKNNNRLLTSEIGAT